MSKTKTKKDTVGAIHTLGVGVNAETYYKTKHMAEMGGMTISQFMRFILIQDFLENPDRITQYLMNAERIADFLKRDEEVNND